MAALLMSELASDRPILARHTVIFSVANVTYILICSGSVLGSFITAWTQNHCPTNSEL